MKFPIRVKLGLMIAALLLLAILAISTVNFIYGRDVLKKRILSDLSALVDSKADRITSIVEQDFERVALIASRLLLRENLSIVQSGGKETTENVDEMIAILKDARSSGVSIRQVNALDLDIKMVVQATSIKSIDVMDMNGKIISSTNPGRIGKDLSKAPIFNEGKKGYFLGNFYLHDDVLMYDMSAPLLNPDPEKKDTIGVLKASIDITRLLDVLNNYEGLGKTGELNLGKRVNNDILFINPLRHKKGLPLELRIPAGSRLTSMMELACDKKDGITIDSDYRGAEVLAAYKYIPVGSWGLIAKIDTKEAFGPIESLRIHVIVDTLLVLILSALAALFLSGFISRPIKKLQKGTVVIASGDLNHRVDIKTNDEIGFLAASFNNMTESLSKITASRNELDREMETRKKTEEALRRSKEALGLDKLKMDSMVKSMTEGVIMLDDFGEVVTLNPRAKWLLGFGFHDEAISETVTEKMKAIKIYEIYQECRSTGKFTARDVTNPQGRILRCEANTVKTADDRIVGVVIVLRDITKEKEIDRMKTEFISTVSHELRTPLTTMKEFASIILDGIPGALNKNQKEYVEIIKNNIDRLSRMINDLLDISKIEAGRIILKKGLLDITELLKGVIFTLKPEADKKHIEIKTLYNIEKSGVYADNDRMIQIFTNLIGNSVKFTPENGTITVEIKENGTDVQCSVADTGVGISSENMEKLFRRFQQFVRRDGSGPKGTGLGLAITRELVEMHGGKIWAESEQGKGSKFYFTIPKHTQETFLKEALNNTLKKAAKNAANTSIIAVSLKELPGAMPQLSEKELDEILKGLKPVLQNGLRRAGDTIIGAGGDLLIILDESDRAGTVIVKDRLEDLAREYLKVQTLAGRLKLFFGYATYPEDAKDTDELIKKAKGGKTNGNKDSGNR